MARTKGAIADKWWADAVRLAVSREDIDSDGEKRRRLNIIADKLCKQAIEGDMQAIKEIGDRLDGRPMAAIDHTSSDGTMTSTDWSRVPMEARKAILNATTEHSADTDEGGHTRH